MAKIVVVGSSNTDLMIKCERIPKPSETVLGGKFIMSSGGKGANQAVAAARLGGDVCFVTKVGEDIYGKMALADYAKEKLNVDYITTDCCAASGIALISVDAKGENSIVVAPGANEKITQEDIDAAKEVIHGADLVLVQLEIPMSIVEYVVEVAHQSGVKVILNPAPAAAIKADVLSKLYMITPNKIECGVLSGIEISDDKSAIKAAEVLLSKGVQNVIITLGAQGALIKSNQIEQFIPANKVDAIDTTAAGDVFNGALCVYLSEGHGLIEAAQFSSFASSISVTRLGAQPSIPSRQEVDTLMNQ